MAKATVVLLFALALSCHSLASAMPGGWTEHDLSVNDVAVQKLVNEVKPMAEIAVKNLEAKSNTMFASKLLEITGIKTQIVAGVNYNISFSVGVTECRKGQTSNDKLESCKITETQDCWTKWYVVPWEKSKQFQDVKCSEMRPVKKRNARSVLGSHEEVEVGDKGVLAAVEYIMKDFNARRNSMFRAVPIDLLNVKRQVVQGYKYSFTLLIGNSNCKNNGKPKTFEECPVDKKSDKMQKCYVEIHHKQWLTENPLDLTTFSCVSTTKGSGKIVKPTNVDSKMNQIPLFGAGGHDQAHRGVFDQFKQKYGKQYKNENEERMRFKIFRENMKWVNQLNENELGDAEYGITPFSDLSKEEFRRYYLNPKWDLSHRPNLPVADIPDEDPPADFDWREHGAVTPVKNQGMCGSCWAFSTTGNIEGIWAVQKDKLVSLSEQELVDCDKLDDGCEGGLPVNAYEEIIRLGGLESEKEYPYDGADDKCKFAVGDVTVYINGSVNISSNEADMAKWLYKNGPISIGINAFAMQFYIGGVSHPFSFLCSPADLDHGVLIVGYGVKKGWFKENPYWIVKNSWGESWGEKGYYLVYRGDGVCGLNQMPTSSIVK